MVLAYQMEGHKTQKMRCHSQILIHCSQEPWLWSDKSSQGSNCSLCSLLTEGFESHYILHWKVHRDHHLCRGGSHWEKARNLQFCPSRWML